MTSTVTQQERDLLTAPLDSENESAQTESTQSAAELPKGDPLSPGQLQSIKALHQKVADRFSNALSNLLQRVVEVRMVNIDAQTYSQFAFSRANPTCLITLNASPLPVPLSIDLSPTFFYPVIDCLLGGGQEPIRLPERAPTEIEKRFARRIAEVLMDELHDAWEPVLAVELDIQSVHHTAQQVRMVAPNENVITLCFRVRVADQTGDFSLCLPVRAIQKMISKLSVNEPPSLQPSPTHFQSQANSESVSLRVVMGTVDVEDFDSLSSGDLIETDLCTDSSVTILADGVEKFVGRPGCAHGKKAVVIERVRAE